MQANVEQQIASGVEKQLNAQKDAQKVFVWKAKVHYIAQGIEVFDNLIYAPVLKAQGLELYTEDSLILINISVFKKAEITRRETLESRIIA